MALVKANSYLARITMCGAVEPALAIIRLRDRPHDAAEESSPQLGGGPPDGRQLQGRDISYSPPAIRRGLMVTNGPRRRSSGVPFSSAAATWIRPAGSRM